MMKVYHAAGGGDDTPRGGMPGGCLSGVACGGGTAPTVEDVTTCGPCTYNITTQEHGNVFAEFESCFDVSVLPDGTA